MREISLSGTTDASGDLTLTTEDRVVGWLEKIEMVYIDGDTGADLTFTSEGPLSQTLLTITDAGTSSTTWYPRTQCNTVNGGACFTTWADKLLVAGSYKIVIAQGGNAKDFKFVIYTSD